MKLMKVLNHELTEEQMKELKEKFNVTEIVTMNEEVQELFKNVTKENYQEVINKVTKEVKNSNCSIMFIQGQMAVVHNVINNCPNVVPIFALTKRVSVENVDKTSGEIRKTSVFKHECFMQY